MSVIRENNLRFSEGLLHEDELWTPILLSNCESVIDAKFRFYYYRCDNGESITRSPEKAQKRALDRIKVSETLAKAYDSDEKYRFNAFGDNIAALYMYGVYEWVRLNTGAIKIKRSFPLKYAKTFKYRLKAMLFCVSPKLACALRARKG